MPIIPTGLNSIAMGLQGQGQLGPRLGGVGQQMGVPSQALMSQLISQPQLMSALAGPAAKTPRSHLEQVTTTDAGRGPNAGQWVMDFFDVASGGLLSATGVNRQGFVIGR